MIPALTRFTEKTLSHIPASYPLMRMYYGNIVRREIELGAITRNDRVMCVGGGAFPATAVEICRKTGAAVDVLDCDEDAVHHARDLLRKLGMWQIDVYAGCGQTFDPAGYSVIHVALQVKGRSEILHHVSRDAELGTRILFRLPHEKLKKFYDRQCPASPEKRSLIKPQAVLQPGTTMQGTCLLVKEVRENERKEMDAGHWLPAFAGVALED